MTKRTSTRRRRALQALILAVAVGAVPVAAMAQPGSPDGGAASGAALGESDTGLWIVQLDEPALAAYTGGIHGLSATSPEVTGAPSLDVDSSASQAYLSHLEDRQDEFATLAERRLGRDVPILSTYDAVLNGVAVEADSSEIAKLAALPGVAAVYPETVREMTTDVSNDIIGSPAVWGGDTGSGAATRGEGVIVGILDSGINPEHPSFAAVDGEGYQHENPLGAGSYLGVCDPSNAGQADEAICNDKLIGAWAFDPRSTSAQDTDGHGSHTASTAAGNVHEATFDIGGTEFTRTVSGVAPRANVIAYRVCVTDCPTGAILAGINQAVIDGVDVLNYSISGSDSPWSDPVELAFLDAFNAGVFVAAAAGNDGPGASTVAHTGPWTAAAAASTTSRAFVQTMDVTPASGTGLTGIATVPGDGGPAVTEPIEASLRDAAELDNALGCQPFASGSLAGSVALIDRGSCEFSVKVRNATSAGAVAVVVANNAGGPPSTMGGLEGTTIPAVMIDRPSGADVRELLAAGDATVRLDVDSEMVIDEAWGGVMADFSSRGPSRLELLAPTLTAPGVNILAAGAGEADRYELMQGTSMASPHVTGAGALLTALHPDWSPSQIRSALALSADPETLVNGDGSSAGVFDQGSGLMDVDAAGRVGLVLEETYGSFQAANPAIGGDPKTLNVPALVSRACAATCTWTRTVTSVADTTATYSVDSASPDGLVVTADPATITLAPGESREIELTAVVSDQPAGEWAQATVSLTTSATHAGGAPIAAARLPVAVVPTAARISVTPGELTATQASDTQTEQTLTIGNTGGQDLSWSVAADAAAQSLALSPTAAVTPVTTTAIPSSSTVPEGFAPSRNPAGTGGVTAAGSATLLADLPDGTVTLTHSASQEIAADNTVACSSLGLTADNGYLRTFTLEDFDIVSDFTVTDVSFGVEAVNVNPITVTVRLYTLDAEPLVYANMTPIGSADVTLQPQALQMVSVPVSGVAPAGSTLVVEIDAPDTRTTSGFFAGSNSAGETAPTYIRSATCGMPEPVAMASAGFPGTHLVMNVTGMAEAPETELPEWVDVQPTSGTVPAGGSQDVTVTFDSTGIEPGSSLSATLLLESNDPGRPFVLVPLTLDVTDGGSPGEPSSTSQEIIATVPEDGGGPGDGSLVISVDPDDRIVQMADMTSAGDRLSSSGELRPVTVTDTRVADPGWDTSAQVSEFASDAATFGGGYLGWAPQIGSVSDGQAVAPGAAITPGFPSGPGLSVPQLLGSATPGGGLGTAVLGAGLDLEIPVDTPTGVYTAVLTITAI